MQQPWPPAPPAQLAWSGHCEQSAVVIGIEHVPPPDVVPEVIVAPVVTTLDETLVVVIDEPEVEPDVMEDPEVIDDPDVIEDPEVIDDPDVIEDPEVIDDPDVIEDPEV